MRRLYALFAFLLIAGFSSVSYAELILQPPGLQPGDKYRLLFLTSRERAGTSTRIQSYNDFVRRTADAAPIVGAWGLDWKALLSTASVDARDNTQTGPNDESMPIYRVDGVLIAENYTEFWGLGGNEVSLNVTEIDTTIVENSMPVAGLPVGVVWTGTTEPGVASSPLGSRYSEVGVLAGGQGAWFNFRTALSTLELPTYALSDPIIAVPEPSPLPQTLIAFCLLPFFLRTLAAEQKAKSTRRF